MRRTIHINFLRDDERVSSNPVRLRIMIPVLCGIVLASLLGWWRFVAAANAGQEREVERIAAAAADLKPAVASFDALVQRVAAARAEIGQLTCYNGSRIVFGDVLVKLPDVVPSTVQFTAVTIPPPARPPAKKEERPATRSRKAAAKAGKAVKPPVEPVSEKVSLSIAGLVDSAQTAARLKAAMTGSDFSGLVKSADIPDGAFKMSADGSGQFLFEISCQCTERSFK
ncbi:MAG: hypothetical protein ACOX9C_08145 [Kiritimatiellia bacterium]|jgi:hypothetical protein